MSAGDNGEQQITGESMRTRARSNGGAGVENNSHWWGE
jgi:hypothetical protein